MIPTPRSDVEGRGNEFDPDRSTPTQVPTSDTEAFDVSDLDDLDLPTESDRSTDSEEYTITSTSTPTPRTLPTNTVFADFGPLVGRTSHFSTYSLQSASISIEPETISRTYPGGAKLLVVARPYPDELFAEADTYGYGFGEPFDPHGDDAVPSVDLSIETEPDSSFYFGAFLAPESATLDALEADDLEYLCETNRLRLSADKLVAEEPDPDLTGTNEKSFSRTVGEGCFHLEFAGSSGRRPWSADLVIYKSAYVEASAAFRNPDRASYVRSARESGLADELAGILDAEARANGFTTKRERVGFVIDFVQNLPYVPDDVSTSFDDYTKSVIETLAEAGGDCEDSSILMASLLQADAFDYDCILLQPPGHMAVGVYGTDLPGTYYEHESRRYYYLETTGRGWSVGEIPDDYAGGSARIYDV